MRYIKSVAIGAAVLILAGIIGNIERGADIGGYLLPIMVLYAFLFITVKNI